MKKTDSTLSPLRFITTISVAILLNATSASAQTAPSLGAAQTFAVLGGTSVSNTGPSVINGDLGISPGLAASITGMGAATVNGSTYAGPLTLAGQAQTDRTAALVNLQGQPCNDSAGATILGPTIIGPGVHCYTSTLLINGPITLDAGGNPNAVFIFKVGSSLTTAVGSTVALTGGAQACNVFWAVTADTTIEVSSTFVGNIVGGRDLVAKTSAHMFGRALTARDLTLDSNTVDATVCSGVGGSGACGAGIAPTITAIPSQVIPIVQTGGSVAVGFTISGSVITDALGVTATSSDTTLVPASAMTITKGVGGARVLTIFGADGRSGLTTITVRVTDPSNCVATRSFQLTVGAVPVPTLPPSALIMLALLLTAGGVLVLRRRTTLERGTAAGE